MTNDSDRGPVRWRRVGLGLIVGGPAVFAIGVHVVHVATRWNGASPSSPGVSALLVLLLGCFVVVGGLLVVHGLRGTKRLPRIVLTLGLVVLLLSGLCISALLLVMLFDAGGLREASQTAAYVTLAISAAALFLLAVFVWKCAWGDPPSRSWWRAHDVSVVLLPITLAVFFLILLSSPRLQHPRGQRQSLCIYSARNLAIIHSERSPGRGWLPYGGKNFVLGLVAHELIDIRNPDNLEIFFCPPRGEEAVVPPREAYEAVTKDALTQRRFPELTDFAGRRNDEPEYRLAAGDSEKREPILGCRFGEHVVIGFSDGAVRVVDREDLGLAPGEEIVFGEASTSPLLRPLSDR